MTETDNEDYRFEFGKKTKKPDNDTDPDSEEAVKKLVGEQRIERQKKEVKDWADQLDKLKNNDTALAVFSLIMVLIVWAVSRLAGGA